LNSSQATLVLSVVPWNNCKEFLNNTKCSDEDVSQHFDKDSLVMVRNLKLSEKFDELPYLIRKTGLEELPLGYMGEIERLDSSNVLIKEYESSKSGLIVFPETFHPLWATAPKQSPNKSPILPAKKASSSIQGGNERKNSIGSNRGVPSAIHKQVLK
jgi:hypothetical protein